MARLPHSTTYTLTRDGEDIDLEIDYAIEPYDPGSGPSYASGGDPPSGGGIEDWSVMRAGEAFELTDAEAETVADWIAENHDHDDDGGYYEYREREYA